LPVAVETNRPWCWRESAVVLDEFALETAAICIPKTATGLPRPPNPARQRMVRDARGSGGSGESAIVIAEKRFGP